MTEVLTAAQMRAIEQAAIDSGAVTGLELMERAGQGVVEAIVEEWPDLSGRAVVLCGPGNNGGDGFVVARLLKARGWEAEVFLFGDADQLPPDAAENHRRWAERGAVTPLEDETVDGWLCDHPGTNLVIDALFGTGLTRPLQGLSHVEMDVNTAQASPDRKVVAVDVPSGLNADTGEFPGLGGVNPMDQAIVANLTVTFHSKKPGHLLSDGPAACGKVVVKDIGLDSVRDRGSLSHKALAALHAPSEPGGQLGPHVVSELTRDELSASLTKQVQGHKYSHGHALVLSGPPGKGGAARLAARAALRIGAGLVTVGCPMRAVAEHAHHLNAIMVHGLDGTHGLAEMLEDTRIKALCLGPGLGLGGATGELVKHALAAERATVLDADALTRFQRQPQALFDMLHKECVLTPHGGEFARLFPDLADRLKQDALYSKVDAAREAAARAGCVVLFKGPDTVIAAPDGRCSINAAIHDRAAPWLATAGSGDVLAGMVCGLLARGFDAMTAAENAAWLHVECALSFGPGLIAEDLPEELPKVLRRLP